MAVEALEPPAAADASIENYRGRSAGVHVPGRECILASFLGKGGAGWRESEK